VTTDPDVGRSLDAVAAFVRTFVVLSEEHIVALALFVFHTHAPDAAETTPYISVTSALPRCGKTRLLEVLELLVRTPLPTANISDAALFRAIEELTPTLLFDEIDTIFGSKSHDRDDLRGMLNAGYRRGALARRMGGANKSTLEAFRVFCPKVFAGIGQLPATLRDRAIRIRLERRIREQEPVERFRRREAAAAAEPLAEGIASLAEHHLERLADARPLLPDELDDRAQDVWEPLLAIADLAGGDWPRRARDAAVALSGEAEREDDSPSVLLLRDIHTVFSANGARVLRTSDLIAELALIEESPWGDWYGKPVTPQTLGKLLKPYGIRTMPVWVGGQPVRGYKADQFLDVWLRVLGVRGVKDVRSRPNTHESLTAPNPPNALASEGDRPNSSRDERPNAPNAPNAHHTSDADGTIVDERTVERWGALLEEREP
jgi:hypothetical protein